MDYGRKQIESKTFTRIMRTVLDDYTEEQRIELIEAIDCPSEYTDTLIYNVYSKCVGRMINIILDKFVKEIQDNS